MSDKFFSQIGEQVGVRLSKVCLIKPMNKDISDNCAEMATLEMLDSAMVKQNFPCGIIWHLALTILIG